MSSGPPATACSRTGRETPCRIGGACDACGDLAGAGQRRRRIDVGRTCNPSPADEGRITNPSYGDRSGRRLDAQQPVAHNSPDLPTHGPPPMLRPFAAWLLLSAPLAAADPVEIPLWEKGAPGFESRKDE